MQIIRKEQQRWHQEALQFEPGGSRFGRFPYRVTHADHSITTAKPQTVRHTRANSAAPTSPLLFDYRRPKVVPFVLDRTRGIPGPAPPAIRFEYENLAAALVLGHHDLELARRYRRLLAVGGTIKVHDRAGRDGERRNDGR